MVRPGKNRKIESFVARGSRLIKTLRPYLNFGSGTLIVYQKEQCNSVRNNKVMKKFDKSVYNHPDEPGEGAKKRVGLNPFDRLRAVMGEFKRKHLRSGSGEHVKNITQAKAIALSESKKNK